MRLTTRSLDSKVSPFFFTYVRHIQNRATLWLFYSLSALFSFWTNFRKSPGVKAKRMKPDEHLEPQTTRWGCISIVFKSFGPGRPIWPAKNAINGRGAPDLYFLCIRHYRHHCPYYDELANWSGQRIPPKIIIISSNMIGTLSQAPVYPPTSYLDVCSSFLSVYRWLVSLLSTLRGAFTVASICAATIILFRIHLSTGSIRRQYHRVHAFLSLCLTIGGFPSSSSKLCTWNIYSFPLISSRAWSEAVIDKTVLFQGLFLFF